MRKRQKPRATPKEEAPGSYYYDDAHGYQVYVDDERSEGESDELGSKGAENMAWHSFLGDPQICHSWNLSQSEAAKLQRELAHRVVKEDDFRGPVKTVAGIDLGYDAGANKSRAIVAVLSFPELKVVETKEFTMPVQFPYIPGLLSFRETPVAVEAMLKLENLPDLIIYDGAGYAHPRRFGIACHIGVLTNIPTIGVAKALLTGKYEEPGIERGSRSPIFSRKEVVGYALRTRTGTKPVFVSIGHRISLETAADYVLKCSPKYRIPETTRVADKLASYRKVPARRIIKKDL